MPKGEFTQEFPGKNNTVTLNSSHPQTKYWPSYLPEQENRIFIFERSKNAQLVVYTANYIDEEKKQLDPKWPLDINWQSFGWTKYPTSNGTGAFERRLAWGYTHKKIDDSEKKEARDLFKVSLVALPSREGLFYIHNETNEPQLELEIGGAWSRIFKVFVQTKEAAMGLVPKVVYVEMFGKDLKTGEDTYEKIIP